MRTGWTALAAVSLFACAGPNTQMTSNSQVTPAPSSSPYVRAIAPFEIRDANGKPFEQPFLGGLDVPRPHFIDIDGDGDFDLFVQERSNELMHFENTGDARSPKYVWRTDKYENLDVGEWTRFVDLDRDGDMDLLAETPYSYIRMYRNEGTKQQATFRPATDSIRDQDNKPIFSDRQNIPQIVDIDCDNLLDLFIGKVEGTITHYEEMGGAGVNGVPRFQFQMDRWENIEIIAQMGPGDLNPSLHGANTMYFADADKDGDLDLYWGDFFEDGVLFIQNTGSCRSYSLRTEPLPVLNRGLKLSTSGYNVPFMVDIDGDQDLDLFVGVIGGAHNPNKTAADNFLFLRRGTDGGYSLETTRFLSMIDLGAEANPTLADLDGDGDLDLIVANKMDPFDQKTAKLHVFRNTGTAQKPAFALRDTITLATAYHYSPNFVDLDGDRDLDLVLGTWNAGVLFYRNEGSAATPRWVQDTTATLQLTRGSNSVPTFGDLDGDGDLDLLVGEASGEVNFYRNSGSAQAFRFELVTEVFQEIDAGRRSHPALLDYDGDGDLDLLMGAEEGGIAYYRNDGSKREPKYVLDPTVRIPTPPISAPAFGDLNGDGRPELIIGTGVGGLLYFEQRR